MKAIIPFMGFTENRGYPSGMEDLWFNVLRRYASEWLTVYHPQKWNVKPDEILSQMRRLRITDVMCVGYSWGAGVGVQQFADKARMYGISIPFACLCDPVYRSRLLPVWLPINPLSLTRHPKIEIPTSINEVYWVKQSQNLPAGHDLVAKNPTITTIHPPETLPVGHGMIDEHPRWKELVGSIVEEFLTL